MFGYTASEAVGRHISLVIPPDRLAEEDQIITTLRAGQRIDHFETERVRKDGRRILVSLTVSPIKDDEGNIVGLSKVVRDVTRQRRAEERERRLLADAAAANAKFQAFFEQGALFAVIMELDGTILEANRLSWEGCGYTREQIVGKPFWEGPWWASSPALARADQGGVRAGDRRRDVPRRDCPTSSPTAASGSRTSRSCRSRTRRDRCCSWPRRASTSPTASAPRPTGEKFVTLVENSTDFIGMCDLEGVPFFVNRAGLEMVGLDDLEQARRMPVRGVLLPRGSARIMDEFFPSVLAKGHGEIEVRFRHFKTGEARWMAYKVLTLPDAAGRPMALRDGQPGRHRAAGGWRTTCGAGGDLSEADRRKNEFLAMLAHELRNPLAPISNAVRALRARTRRREALRTRRSEMIERQVGQLARLVDDLLDVSRITRGKIELRKQPRRAGAGRRAGRRGGPRAVRRACDHELTVTLPTAAGASRRRPGAAGAGVRQPAQQRLQVHRPGRPHRADGRARRRRRRSSACGTTASASPPR